MLPSENQPQPSLLPHVSSEEQALQSRTTRPRLFQLDALRGIAALTVVFCHTRAALTEDLPGFAIAPFVAGSPSVTLFFVLSGYVLSLPYWNGTPLPYSVYLRRRLCRIYLPFAAAAAVSILAAFCFRHFYPPLTGWFLQTWHGPFTLRRIAKQFLMVPMATYNTAFWTLTYEMQMSIVMPLLCAVMRRVKPIVFTAVWGLALYLSPDKSFLPLQVYLNYSVQIVFLFALGASLAFYRDRIGAVVTRWPRWAWVTLAVSCLAYFDYPVLLVRHHPSMYHKIFSRDFLITGLGAAVILVGSLYLEPFARLLKHGLPEYLGRISYSLYLTHGIVLFAAFDLLYGRIATPWVVAIVPVAALALADGFYRLVEAPSMRLGQRIKPSRRPA